MRIRWSALPLAALLLVLNLRLHAHAPRDGAEARAAVEPQLAWLDAQLDAGAAERMQTLFPEGFFFTHALVGLSAANLALENPGDEALRVRSLARAERALAALRSPPGRAPFDPFLDPPYGAFCAGWTTLVAGAVLALGGEDPGYAPACAELAAAYGGHENPFLPSYSGQSWPVDSVVAVSALALCDQQLGEDHTALLADWVRRARARTDPSTGLLTHQADADSGAPYGPPRASSLAMSLLFLSAIDPRWDAEQYEAFRANFVARRLGLPGVLEHRGGYGQGDIDAGPLIAGVSLSASAVALGAARIHGDWTLADDLIGAGEALGLPLTWGGQKRYALGLVPVGDAFGALSLSARPVVQAPRPALPRAADPWRLPWHLASAGLALLALWRR